MSAGSETFSVIVAVVLSAIIAAVLAVSDTIRFEEPAFSPLYKSTLEQAYSRFRQSDKRVPPKPLAAQEGEIIQPAAQVQAAKSKASAAHKPAVPAHAYAASSADLSLGNQLFSQKRYDEALKAFQKYVQANPNSALGFHRIADVLVEQSKLKEALSVYQKALSLQPDFYCIYGHMGDVYAKLGQNAAAEKFYKSLVEGFTKQAQQGGETGISACFQLARFYVDHDRNLDQAVTLAQKAAAAHPNEISYLVLLERAYRKAGMKEKALETIDKILKLRPDFKGYYQTIRAQLTSEAPEKKPAAPQPQKAEKKKNPRSADSPEAKPKGVK